MNRDQSGGEDRSSHGIARVCGMLIACLFAGIILTGLSQQSWSPKSESFEILAALFLVVFLFGGVITLMLAVLGILGGLWNA